MHVDEILRHSKIGPVKRYTVYDPEKGESVFYPGGKIVDQANFYPAEMRDVSRTGRGNILGTIGDWLVLMGARREDNASARELAVNSPEHERLIRLGFKDNSTPGEIKAGTISFRADEYQPPPFRGQEQKPQPLMRKVHINGNIRAHAANKTYHARRGKTYEPMTAQSHPDLTPVERLAGSMRRSIGYLARLYRKSPFKLALDRFASKD